MICMSHCIRSYESYATLSSKFGKTGQLGICCTDPGKKYEHAYGLHCVLAFRLGRRPMSKVNVDQIVSPEQAIHPCLDWVKGQLIVGVNLRAGATAVLSSVQGLVSLDGLGPICPQGKAFNGAVSRTVADQFVKYLETRPEGML